MPAREDWRECDCTVEQKASVTAPWCDSHSAPSLIHAVRCVREYLCDGPLHFGIPAQWTMLSTSLIGLSQAGLEESEWKKRGPLLMLLIKRHVNDAKCTDAHRTPCFAQKKKKNIEHLVKWHSEAKGWYPFFWIDERKIEHLREKKLYAPRQGQNLSHSSPSSEDLRNHAENSFKQPAH